MFKKVLAHAGYLQITSRVSCAVFSYSSRQFLKESPCVFCQTCANFLARVCNFNTAHRYGSFEAERWNGLYIYYCPKSLAFISTPVYGEEGPLYALVSGPAIMGQLDDILWETDKEFLASIKKLPQKSPAQITALAQIQQALAGSLSGLFGRQSVGFFGGQAMLLNTLYDVTTEIAREMGGKYPLEIEQKLRGMISRADKSGAQELINQLLGHVYFESGGQFALIKQRAKDLIVLFSRASIDGGADINQIFGQYKNLFSAIDGFGTLEELSYFLTSVFYRFVGYVFDFSKFEHTDIMQKVVNFVRDNYKNRITLEDAAAFVGLSRNYLSGIIKEELGMPFSDYVHSVRVEKSKELLPNPALGLAEIADLVGYSDQSYYTKAFTRITGVSPGKYRKKGRHFYNI